MKFFSKHKNKCEQCDEVFISYNELMHHARHVHHHTIVKCTGCSKEFIHEKDRLHHSRIEHEEKMQKRSQKESYPEKHTLNDRLEKNSNHFHDKL